MRILTTLPQEDLNDIPAAARAAEAAGYDGLVTSENRNEPFLPLGVAAVNTTHVSLYRNRSGRSREHFEISGGGFIATGPDEESVTKMLDPLNRMLRVFLNEVTNRILD